MKPLPLLLAASLIANAAWITVQVIDNPSTEADAHRQPLAAVSGTPAAHTHKAHGPDNLDLVAALKANDVEALRDLLRAAGLPDETVRSIVGTAIWKRYSEGLKALQPRPDPNQAWWKNEPHNRFSNLTREQRAEQRRLQREASEETARVLGPNKNGNPWGWQDPRLSFLSEAKLKDFQEIEQDYQDLLHEVQQEMQGFLLPSDSEKIRFLQEEKKRDLAAILTPAELADYELRMSPTAQQLRWKMTRFDGTEDEYRKIFALQKAFDSTQQTDAWGNPINQGPDDWKKRREDEKQLSAQIKTALGPDRYADYVRSQNHEYQQLTAATKRLSLPPETATAIYDLRHGISAESQRIADNANLATEQKKQAFIELANRTRDQIRASLGAEAAEVYLKGGMHWLNTVEQGHVVTFAEDGSQSTRPGIPREPKSPAAKP